jgi:hypothetical protein
VTEVVGPWEFDRRVRNLLERNMDEDEYIRFGIEGLDGQIIVALDERLLVVKPGSAEDPNFSGLLISIYYRDITDIGIGKNLTNRVINIYAPSYEVTEARTWQVTPERDFFRSNDPLSMPIAKWAVEKYKPHLYTLGELVKGAKEA